MNVLVEPAEWTHKNGGNQNWLNKAGFDPLSDRGLGSRMPFPGNQIFHEKNWEISRPEHSGTSSSRSQLSTGIQDWLLPGLVSGREIFGNSRMLPEWKFIIIWTVPNEKSPEWYCLLYLITIYYYLWVKRVKSKVLF